MAFYNVRMSSSGSGRGAQFSLAVAILFALVATGFSAFILFWKAPENNEASQAPKVLTTDQKEAAIQQLRDNAPKPILPPAPPDAKPPTPSEADPSDTNAAAKLQILHSLNAK